MYLAENTTKGLDVKQQLSDDAFLPMIQIIGLKPGKKKEGNR